MNKKYTAKEPDCLKLLGIMNNVTLTYLFFDLAGKENT